MSVRVGISFPDALLAHIDVLIERKGCSRSELLRRATRLYFERKGRWDRIFALGRATAARRGLVESDVAAEIEAHRKPKRARR
ncbi:MAG: ribbon-helix-helix protein, CopG family [Sedimentisphaerales bacterium]|nr:ribbon-helix-helix protein, CopG family [Sedimentisphaerales bacterium]